MKQSPGLGFTLCGGWAQKSPVPVLMEQSGAGKESGVGSPTDISALAGPLSRDWVPAVPGLPRRPRPPAGGTLPGPSRRVGAVGGASRNRGPGGRGGKPVLGKAGRLTMLCSCPGRGRPGWGTAGRRGSGPGGSYLGHRADVRGSGLSGLVPGPGTRSDRPQTPSLACGERWSTGRARPQPPGLRRGCGTPRGRRGREAGRPLPVSAPALERRVRTVLPSGWPGGRAEPGLGGLLRSSLSPSSQSGSCPLLLLPSLLQQPLRGKGASPARPACHTRPLSPRLAAAPSLRPVLPGEGEVEAGPRLTGAHCTSVLCARSGAQRCPVPGNIQVNGVEGSKETE